MPSAQRAGRARSAQNAAALGGLPYHAYLSRVRVVRTSTSADRHAVKGPLSAQCPAGSRLVAGGAEVVGTDRGVALLRSAPNGPAWAGLATAYKSSLPPWRLVVTAVCAAGGH